MSTVAEKRMPKDPRVEAAISHWAPRFVINGVPLTDFQEVTASIDRSRFGTETDNGTTMSLRLTAALASLLLIAACSDRPNERPRVADRLRRSSAWSECFPAFRQTV